MNRLKSVAKPLMWLMALVVATVVTGCSSGSSSDNAALSSTKTMTAFSISGNAGTIDQTAKTISVTLPSGTAVKALVATFTTTGVSVNVGTVAQASGTTPNDFTNPVLYQVIAADSTRATYTVLVTVASTSTKAITAYSLAWTTGTPGSAAGVITEPAHTIAVTVPFGTSLPKNMIATFTTSGANVVKVVGTTQVSGTTQNTFTASPAYLTYTVFAADNSMANYDVTVTVTATSPNPTAPDLGEAGRFAILAYAAVTTTGSSASAISNGDIGTTPLARSFAANGFTTVGSIGELAELTGTTWAGSQSLSYAANDDNATFPYPLYYAPHNGLPVNTQWTTTAAMLTQASTDEGAADVFLAADPNPGAPTQVCPTELGGQTLTRGVYKTASDVTIQTGTLYLDAQGDPNSVWIFNISGSLTTVGAAPSGNIAFVGGIGSAKNVYWRVQGGASIAANSTFLGNIFDTSGAAGIAVLSGANITGSLFATPAGVTLISNTITKP